MTAAPNVRQRGAFDADEAEFRAIRAGASTISSGIQDEVLSGEVEELAVDPPFQLPTWERDQSGSENLAGAALEVVQERSRLLGLRYPFELDRGSLTYRGRSPFYNYLLATSGAAGYQGKQFQILLRQFERVVCDLLVAFAGGDAQGLRIGWPSERGLDRILTTNMSRRVARMKAHCGFHDEEWKMDANRMLEQLRRRAKDARIDFVVRRSFEDKRCGALSIIGQCGCGKNDVDESSRKHEDLSDNWLETFFNRITVPRPLKVFATSQHMIGNEEFYIKQSAANAIIVDRIRLCLLAVRHPRALLSHRARLTKLTNGFFKATSAP